MSTILLLGGTGKTARRIARRLTDAGHDPRPASRHPEGGGVPFDWDDPASWDAALAGADAVYLVPPALRLQHDDLMGSLTERAVTAGARRLVMLSAHGVDASDEIPLRRSELAVQAAAGDVAPTLLRPTWFMQNFTESFFRPGIEQDGTVVAPAGDGAEAFVDVEDIAAVAVAALTEDGHAGRAYAVTGPDRLTFAQAAAILSETTGREVRHVDLPVEDWKSAAVAAGALPADYAELLGALFDRIRAGHGSVPSGDVEEVTGRPGRSFSDWARAEAGALSAA